MYIDDTTLLCSSPDPVTRTPAGLTLVKSRQGGCCNPLTVFLRSLENAKESYQGHLGNLFYTLCGHFHGKKMGVPPYPGGG